MTIDYVIIDVSPHPRGDLPHYLTEQSSNGYPYRELAEVRADELEEQYPGTDLRVMERQPHGRIIFGKRE